MRTILVFDKPEELIHACSKARSTNDNSPSVGDIKIAISAEGILVQDGGDDIQIKFRAADLISYVLGRPVKQLGVINVR